MENVFAYWAEFLSLTSILNFAYQNKNKQTMFGKERN